MAARTARILVLAGTERLDKELMIGQMQGKFQMVVVPGVGHMVQEVLLHFCPSHDKFCVEIVFLFCRMILQDWLRSW